MHPLIPSTSTTEIDRLTAELLSKCASIGSGLHPKVQKSVSTLLTKVNSYYTNAMEGNPSKLKDIEAALNNKLSTDARKRNYQLEHLAHIAVQSKMLERLESEPELNICSAEFLCWIHKEFYDLLPPELHVAHTHSGSPLNVKPGIPRDIAASVGTHLPPETQKDVEQCLNDFTTTLAPESLNQSRRYLAFASSHHRLLWIHPFRDGNGRVARLFSIAYQHRIGLHANGLWVVTRAFARNRKDYDQHLALADEERISDTDGRGPLSEAHLLKFCEYFLTECLDQADYMQKQLELLSLEKRYRVYIGTLVAQKAISKKAGELLEALLYRGEIERGETQKICNIGRRRATEIIKELLEHRLVASPSPRGKLQLHFSSETASILFPQIV